MKYRLLLLLCISLPVYADVYKWVDADGKVHYGDRPNSTKAQEIKIKPKAPVSTGHSHADKNQKSIEKWLKARDEERRINKKKEAASKKERDILKKECISLKSDLRDRQQGGVVWYDLDETGKRRYYSDKEIKLEIEALKKTIRKKCPS